MTTESSQFTRITKVSEYYRYILKSQLLIPAFAKSELNPHGAFSTLLQNIDTDTEYKVRNYPLDMPENKAIAFKAFILAMLCVQRHAGNPKCMLELENLKIECLGSDTQTRHYGFNFAMLYLNLGAVDKCVLELEESVRLFPDFGQAHAALALLYTINEDWSSGVKHAREALARNTEIRPQLVDLCLSSCSYNLDLPIEGVFDYSALGNTTIDHLENTFDLLPPVDINQLDHSAHNKKILFVYADEHYYYEHVLALVCSLRDTGVDWVVHLHLCNPSPKLVKDLHNFQQLILPMEIYYSFEQGDLARFGDANMYHSCVRFCRLYQLVSINPHTIIMIDADMLFTQNPDTLTDINNDNKVIGLTKTSCEPFWATIRAGFCFFRKSDTALEFLGQLTQFIVDNLKEKKGHWFIDQMGLSILYTKLTDRSAIALLPASECCDSTISDNAIIWAIVNDKVSMGKYNIRKHQILKSYGLN